MPNTGWWEELWPDPAGVLAAVGVEPGMNVVDLCSGDGWFTRPLARIAGHVTAIDIDPNLLDAARRSLAKSELAKCDLIPGDAYDLAILVSSPVDFVLLANAFHGVPDQLRLARAVRTTLRPGGLFAIVNWHQRPRGETRILGEPRGPRDELRMSPDMTIKAVEASDLRLKKLIEIPPYHYGAVFSRNEP